MDFSCSCTSHYIYIHTYMQTNVYMNSLTSYEYMHNFFSPFPLTSNEQKASGNNPGEERQVIRNLLRYLQSAFWQSNKPEGKRHQICFCIFFFTVTFWLVLLATPVQSWNWLSLICMIYWFICNGNLHFFFLLKESWAQTVIAKVIWTFGCSMTWK